MVLYNVFLIMSCMCPKKVCLLEKETEFLGMNIGKNGIEVNPETVKVLQIWRKLRSVVEVWSFIGLLKFFQQFIPKFAKITTPLTKVSKKGLGVYNWNNSCDKAFECLKYSIIQALILTCPECEMPYRGHVDSSQFAVGGTLTQSNENRKN